jgi:hypothetical protein
LKIRFPCSRYFFAALNKTGDKIHSFVLHGLEE